MDEFGSLGLGSYDPAGETAESVCPRCGEFVDPGQESCANCGHVLGEPVEVTPDFDDFDEAAQSTAWSLIFFTLLAVIVVAAIGVLIWRPF